MKYRFRLQKMLHFEELKEAIKRGEVAKAIDGLKKLEDRRLGLENTMREVLEQTPERLKEDAAWVPYQVSQVQSNLAECRKLDEAITQAKDHLELIKFELSKLSMKRKALENLRDKKKSEFRLSESRKEQKRLDETHQLNSRREK